MSTEPDNAELQRRNANQADTIMELEADVAAQKEKIVAAQKAVKHLLNRTLTNHETRRAIGIGSKSYELLTEAAAALFDEPVENVRKVFPG